MFAKARQIIFSLFFVFPFLAYEGETLWASELDFDKEIAKHNLEATTMANSLLGKKTDPLTVSSVESSGTNSSREFQVKLIPKSKKL